MIRKMTADDIADVMDRSLKRSVAEQFLWEVHTIDGEIVVCIHGKEITISADDACRFAKVASGEGAWCMPTGMLECGWGSSPRAIFVIRDGHRVVEMNERAANEFAAALREAAGLVGCDSKNRTDENLRSVFG